MAPSGKTPATIITALIILLGIIHLGVGAGIVAKYRQYSDVFRQPVGLCAFIIIIGIYAIIIGIVCLIGILQERADLGKAGAVCAAVLGVFAIASLITALVLNTQAIGFLRGRLSYRMNSYVETDGSIDVMDRIQNRYKCCGVNLWLDWSRAGLGTTVSTGSGGSGGSGGGGTVSGSGSGTTSGGGSVIGTRSIADRRRRHVDEPSSPLVDAVRRRRQTSSGNIYNLPTSYTINLPLSCCKSGGQSTGNSVGGYCVFSASNGTTGFYVQGCLSYVGDRVVSQISGIAVINVVLAILSIVLIPVLRSMFPQSFDPNNPNNKQPLANQPQQEPQMQNGGYYADNNNMQPPAYYSYPQQQSVYVTYQ